MFGFFALGKNLLCRSPGQERFRGHSSLLVMSNCGWWGEEAGGGGGGLLSGGGRGFQQG